MRFIVLSVLWIIFCALHSVLISIPVTEFMKERLKNKYRFYRLLYNLFSFATFIPVMLYTWSISGEYFFEWGGYLKILRFAMIISAIILIIFSLKEYDWLQFIGLRQILNDRAHCTMNSSGSINDSGVLGIMRHPLYTSVFLLLWAGKLNLTLLIVNIILSIYLVIGTKLEEQKLVAEFGSDYLEYKKRVSMYFPAKWIYKNFSSLL